MSPSKWATRTRKRGFEQRAQAKARLLGPPPTPKREQPSWGMAVDPSWGAGGSGFSTFFNLGPAGNNTITYVNPTVDLNMDTGTSSINILTNNYVPPGTAYVVSNPGYMPTIPTYTGQYLRDLIPAMQTTLSPITYNFPSIQYVQGANSLPITLESSASLGTSGTR